VDEEIGELDAAIAGAAGRDAVEAEFGDLLFALVNYGRHLGIDPESALRRSNEKFVRRFRAVEQRAAASGVSMQEAGLDRLDGWWEEAKREEREP
jgi:ATP diphosphatase